MMARSWGKGFAVFRSQEMVVYSRGELFQSLRATVGARVAAAPQYPVRLTDDDLAAPKQAAGIAVHAVRCMSQSCQAGNSLRWSASFKCDVTAADPICDAKTRLIQSCLWVKTVIYERDYNLQVALRLHKAAHHAKGCEQAAVCGAREHTGNNSVIRALVRCYSIGMAGYQAEVVAAVLQREAASRRNQAGAKA